MTVGDMVTVHRRLLAHLGVTGLHAVVGGSLGGMQALHWLLRYPADARRYLIIAATARLSADNLAANAIGRVAIRSDPAFNGGHYHPSQAPAIGLGLARMIGHLSYLSAEALEDKFGRDLTPATRTAAIPPLAGDVAHGPFAVESYLEHQAAKLVARFDASSYLYLMQAMDRFDAFADPPRPLADTGAIAYLFSFASDRLFGLSHSLQIRNGLEAAGLTVRHHHDTTSRAGHDAFLLPVPGYLEAVRGALWTTRLPDQAVIAGIRPEARNASEAVTA
jgi:homoserine O-acetyltransferase